MNYSKYNVYADYENQRLIYNTISGAFMGISKDDLSLLEKGEKKTLEELLLKNGILIHENKDELLTYKYKSYMNMFRSSQIAMTIAPTMACNLSCNYCFEGGNKKAEFMSKEVIDAIAKSLKEKSRNKKININWFGGEPILGLDQILALSGKLKDEGISYTCSMITNGTLLNKENRARLKSMECNWSYIQITFDGIGENHNKKRFFKGKKGSFDTILENLDGMLKEFNINIVVQVNVDKENPTAYEDAFQLLYSLYPEYIKKKQLQIQYNHIQNRNNFKGCGSCYEEDERMKLLKQYDALSNAARRPIRIPGKQFPCMLRSANSYVIGPDGSIYKCLEHLGDKSKRIGNLLEGISLYKKAEYSFVKNPFEDEECVNCNVFPICGGGCPLDRMRDNGNKEENVCSFYKKHMPEIMRMTYSDMKSKG